MTTIQKHLSQRVKYLSVFDILSALTRMGIERFNAGSCRPALQSPAVLVIALEVMLGFVDKDMLCHQQLTLGKK